MALHLKSPYEEVMKMDKTLYISAGRYKTCERIFENLAEIPYAVIKGELK